MSDVLSRFRLDGRTAIVAGVGAGLGEHIARGLASVGASVVCASRTVTMIEQVAASIIDDGGAAIAVPTDVAVREDVVSLVAAAQEAYGGVDVVVYNAYGGIVPFGQDPWATDDAVWEEALAVNLMAPYRLACEAMPSMRRTGRGSFVTVLSSAGFMPVSSQIAYGATKSGLHMMTRYLAKHAAPDVRFNAICPGSITPDGGARESFSRVIERNAIKRVGAADEVVGAALYLASDASSYTTGSVIFAEGGRVGTVH